MRLKTIVVRESKNPVLAGKPRHDRPQPDFRHPSEAAGTSFSLRFGEPRIQSRI
jgi:hypothetical protein